MNSDFLSQADVKNGLLTSASGSMSQRGNSEQPWASAVGRQKKQKDKVQGPESCYLKTKPANSLSIKRHRFSQRTESIREVRAKTGRGPVASCRNKFCYTILQFEISLWPDCSNFPTTVLYRSLPTAQMLTDIFGKEIINQTVTKVRELVERAWVLESDRAGLKSRLSHFYMCDLGKVIRLNHMKLPFL